MLPRPARSPFVGVDKPRPYDVLLRGHRTGLPIWEGRLGLLTLRSEVFSRWTGVVALIGAVSFLVTFAAVLSGLGEDSLFGFGFFPGVLALVIWSIATSLARYRALSVRYAQGNSE